MIKEIISIHYIYDYLRRDAARDLAHAGSPNSLQTIMLLK